MGIMGCVRVCALIFAWFLGSLAQDTFVYDSKLFVDGLEFIVKGVDYSPTPLGVSNSVGLCSNKMTAYAEWKSACFDSDFFDGSPWLSTNPSVQGFKSLWQRDFPNIAAMGANTIRLYNANPTTWAASQIYKNIIPSPTGKDHTQFMQMCIQYNFKVIFPLVLDNTLFASDSEPIMKRFYRWQIDEVGNFSSLLMWQLGNEQTWTWQSTQWKSAAIYGKFNDYVDYIKRYTYSKWGRRVPVSFSIQNSVAYEYDWLITHTHVDIFATNVFEGGDHPSQSADTQRMTQINQGTQHFPGMAYDTCAYAKPYLVTEFGWTYTNGISNTYPAGEINRYWAHILANIDSGGFIGGVYFELTDEPGNGGKDQGVYKFQTGYQGSNSSMGANQLVPDAVVVRNPQLSDISSGSYNGKPYNFNTNVYTLLNRAQSQYATTVDRCPSSTYKACPGNTIPVCNSNGMCNRLTGTCTCGTGWTGADCSTPVCPGSPACSGRGSCSTLVSPPECFCNPGYYGTSCELTPAPGACPGENNNNCTNGNGVCNSATWTCACWPGWTGLDCAVTDLHGLGSRTSSSSASTSATLGFTTSSSATIASTTTLSFATATVAASSSASTTGVVSTSTGSLSLTATQLAVSSTGSLSVTASQLAASSTGSVAATTTQSASTSATLAASSTSSVSTSAASVAVTSTGSISTAATYSASTSAVSASTVGATTSASASVAVTSTGSTSATLAASSSASTSATSAKATTTAKSTTSSTASTSNQLATSTVSVDGATATASYASTTTVGAVTSSTTLAGSSTSSASASVVVASTSSTIATSTSSTVATSTGSTAAASTSATQLASSSTSSTADAATTSSQSTTTSTASEASTTSSSSTAATQLSATSSTSTATVSATVSLATRATVSTTTSTTIGVTTVASSSSSGRMNVTSLSASTSGRTNITSGSSGLSTIGGSTTSSPKPTMWDVTVTLVIPGNYQCLDLNDLSVVLHQIFKIFPDDVKVLPNANNQTWFSVNATFVVANSSIFANATKVLMSSTIIQNLIPNCGPNIISASVTTSVYVAPNLIVSNGSSRTDVNSYYVILLSTLLVLLTLQNGENHNRLL